MEEKPNLHAGEVVTKRVPPEKEVHDALTLARQYGPAIGIGLVLGLALILFTVFRQQQKAASEEAAFALFQGAQTADQMQLVIDQYPGSAAAPMAKLSLASRHFRESRFDQARDHYSQFIERFPRHMMRPAAELGLAYSDEALGRLPEALEGFRSFRIAHPDHYLTPVAHLDEARLLGKLGRVDEARAIYESILDDPDHAWRMQARTDLLYLEKDVRAAP